ncbi:flagellar basal body rod protein FlgC [Sedimentibacter sp. zth1]|uniref:flagellar basal body rod protein FlgC n=1 Tax=Sedimentibacter sp. zth1 TaxID=2816908 RepID=UPI001A92210B|nr:flagellar basal body rod protein FlgC [Sedimentibacter sp. zth1]QSX07204.1 flagellar basal body rod protein FlgC [Sedimentibacter sp. zth1]
MSFLQSMNISGSALTAQRLRMDIISENIANIDTTRTQKGGPYKRKMVVFESKDQTNTIFSQMLNNIKGIDGIKDANTNKGVEVSGIIEDEEPFKLVYNPTHPDANEDGYVEMPNVDSLKETIDMMEVVRAYQSNITALNAIKEMASKALEIGR